VYPGSSPGGCSNFDPVVQRTGRSFPKAVIAVRIRVGSPVLRRVRDSPNGKRRYCKHRCLTNIVFTVRKMRFKIPYWPLLVGPILSFGIGFTLNAIVIAANHGSMPVLVPGGCEPGMISEIHSCMTRTSHLKFLADWILVRGIGIASPGDFLELLFDATFMPALYMWMALVIRKFNDTS
jgi:hypothetical protein